MRRIWLKPGTVVALWAGAGLTIVLMLANVFLTYRNTRQLEQDATLVAHTLEVITGLERVLSFAKDAETGQRGFIITNDEAFLEPYYSAIGEVDAQLDEVRKLTADNAEQQAAMPALRQLIATRLDTMKAVIDLQRDAGFDAARQKLETNTGKAEMDALRAMIGEMIQRERDLLQVRSSESQSTYQLSLFSGLASGLSAMVAILAFLLLLRQHLVNRAKSEFVIAEQGERLRTTLASIGDGVITTDTEGRVTNLNAVAESLTGWRTAEAAGQSLEVVFRIVNEDTRNSVENPVTRSLREGAIIGLANHTVLLAKDGHERPIDDSAAPIRCAEGEIVGCVLVFRDISERKASELALRTSEERLRLALSADRSMGWWDVDLATEQAVWSPSLFHILGYAPNDAGRATLEMWNARLHPDDRAKTLASIDQAKAQRSLYSQEYRIQREDGEAVWLSPFGHFHYDHAGNAVRFVGVFFDVTGRKKAEDELRRLAAELSEADRRKDEFLSILAHELRNPLAPLRNGLQIIRFSSDDGHSVEQARTMMERQLGHLVRLVDDLLDVSRISRGKFELRKERVELGPIINNAVETSRPLIDAGRHALAVVLPAKPIYVDADVVRLAQVFANLLNNSAKYTEPGGRISISAERDGTLAIIRVKDSGIGIPAEMLPRVFDMFTQVDRSLERAQGGLGIGLTLVKRLVEMHHGTIEVKSGGAGQGSEFIVRLPVVLSLVQESPGSSEAVEWARPNQPRRVLVADDNVDAARSLALLLKLKGHEVRTAADGMEALEAAEKFLPEVVLLDIGMPKLNGYEVGRRIREQSWGKNIVLAALTGWGQEEDKQRSRDAGFDYHIVKPVDAAALDKVMTS